MALKWGWRHSDQELFWTVLTTADLARVSKRVMRKPGPWLKVWRGDLVHMFATRPLGGRKEPTVWHEMGAQRAVQLLVRHALALPGVDKVIGKHGWRVGSSSEKGTGLNECLGRVSDEDWEDALEATAADIYDATGIQITPEEPLPVGVDVQMFISILTSYITGDIS